MQSDIILDKLKYHKKISQPVSNLESLLRVAGYNKDPQQFDKLNYYTSIHQPSLIDRLKAEQ